MAPGSAKEEDSVNERVINREKEDSVFCGSRGECCGEQLCTSSSILLALVCVLCVFYVHAWPQLCCTYSATGKGSLKAAISVLLLRDIFRAVCYFL